MIMISPISISQDRKRAFEKKDLYDHDRHSFLCPRREGESFEKKALYDHDHHSFPFPEEKESFTEEGSV